MTRINGIDHYGKEAPYKGKEDELQKWCAQYLSYQPDCLFFHVPNGGSRNRIEAAKLKGMGTRAGVADLIILHPTSAVYGYPGLFVELKVAGGKLSPAQNEFLLASDVRGYQVAVCWNFDGFKELVDGFLKSI